MSHEANIGTMINIFCIHLKVILNLPTIAYGSGIGFPNFLDGWGQEYISPCSGIYTDKNYQKEIPPKKPIIIMKPTLLWFMHNF